MKPETYDYVIVGAGSAGCTLAYRLGEDARKSILVLEAGGADDKNEIHVPGASAKLHRSSVDWALESDAQAACGDRRLYVPRGKVLGGSSSTNTMIYIRGQPEDYDAWADVSDAGWGWASMLEYFKRSEDYAGQPSAYHGRGGPLHVEPSDARWSNRLWDAFVEAAPGVGYEHNTDFNGPNQRGFGKFDVTTLRGRRCSAARAFLRPALRRGNTTVVTHAPSSRVILEGDRAIGVVYSQGGEERRAYARSEVILCAGALHSPKLLMLSGIGPPDHLRAHEITVRVPSEDVGAHLQDHPAVPLSWGCRAPLSVNGAGTPEDLMAYAKRRRGPLAAVVPAAGAFVSSAESEGRPDIEIHFAAAWSRDVHSGQVPRSHGFTMLPCLLRPESRGRVRLRSAAPDAAPGIDLGFLTAAADRRALIDAVRICERIVAQASFDELRGRRLVPHHDLRDEDVDAYVAATVMTTYHPVGTCRMGRDSSAVVDEALRVRGAEGLRVVDASVMPRIVSGNTNAPVIAIAERAADLIREAA